MHVALASLVALLAAAPVLAQGGYVPRDERGRLDARVRTNIESNGVRTSLFNFGQSGRTGAVPDEIPYEWPRGTRRHYLALTGLLVGARVESVTGQPTVIVDVPNYRTNTNDPSGAWTWAPVPEYLGGGQFARSDRPETWPAVWPDRLGDADDPGWAGSWNGLLGKGALIDGVEAYTHYTDDGYTRNRRSEGTTYHPDSTDLDRAGLGVVVSERTLAFRDPLVSDAVFTVRDLYNAGTEDLAAVGATVWVADLVGGDIDAGDDVPLFVDDLDLVVFGDRDGMSTDPAFLGTRTVGAVALVLLEAPGEPAFANVQHLPAGAISFQTVRDEVLYYQFMVPAPYVPPAGGAQDNDAFASVAPFPLAAGTSARLVTALVFAEVDYTYSASNPQMRYAVLFRKAEQARAFYAGGFVTATEVDPVGEGVGLRGVSPNPSSAETRVAFSLSAPQTVRLDVLDVLGRRVAVLADGPLAAGPHEATWDGRSGGVRVGSGVYVLRLTTPDGVQTRTVVRLR